MAGVDRHDQLRMQYNIGRFAKKAWKYLMWFFVNASIVNAFILWKKCTTREMSKARFTHLDFRKEVACSLIAGFTCRKRRADVPLYAGPTQTENEANHESVHMGGVRNGKRCKWHLMQKRGRKMTIYGCRLCGVHLCREGCHFEYHAQQ